MNDEIYQVIEEKFTRCPLCRSFSVRIITDLTFKEKLKSHFVPVTVQRCSNCSHRFVTQGNLREGFKQKCAPLTSTFPRKCIVAAVPLILVALLVVLLLVSGGKKDEPITPVEKTPQQTIETIETQPPRGEETQPGTTPGTGEETPAAETGSTQAGSEEIQQPSTEETGETQTTPVPTFAGEIILVRNRFGVNWRPLGDGVQITRLSPGPVKDAGLLVGDIILEVDDVPVKGEGSGIELARDEVFMKKRPQAVIKVQRNNKILLFKMVKK